MNQADVAKLCGIRLVMPWGTRQVRLCYSLCDGHGANKSFVGASPKKSTLSVGDVTASSPTDPADYFRLSPLPSAKHFVAMDGDEKRRVLEHALNERTMETSATIVGKYHDHEDQLFDMISEIGAQAVYDSSDLNEHCMKVESAQHELNIIVNDIIEVAKPSSGGMHSLSDDSIVIKVRHVEKTETSMHIDGTLISSSGKEQKLCDLFAVLASIKRVVNGGRDYVVLS